MLGNRVAIGRTLPNQGKVALCLVLTQTQAFKTREYLPDLVMVLAGHPLPPY